MPFTLDTINLFLIITAILNLYLGAVIIFNNFHKRTNLVYAGNIIAIIGWVMAMIIYRSSPQETALFWCTILYITPTFIASSFLYFTYIFPSQQVQNLWWRKSLIIFLNTAIVIMVVWPGFIIREVNIRPGLEKEIIFSKYYWFYFLYTSCLFTYGFLKGSSTWLFVILCGI